MNNFKETKLEFLTAVSILISVIPALIYAGGDYYGLTENEAWAIFIVKGAFITAIICAIVFLSYFVAEKINKHATRRLLIKCIRKFNSFADNSF